MCVEDMFGRARYQNTFSTKVFDVKKGFQTFVIWTFIEDNRAFGSVYKKLQVL